MATQRLLEPGRPGNALVQIISILGARRRELKASVGERLLLLDTRRVAFESRQVELEARLASAEGHLDQLDRARVARSLRIVHLREQLQILRPREVRQEPAANPAMHRLGSALMFVGGLLVLWVVLLELGLALGLT